MRYFVRWWETLGRAERIVALSIGLSAPVAIINSTVWALAVAYMVHEKSRVEIERLHAQVGGRLVETAESGDRAETQGVRSVIA
jgi:hypothetical protein